VNRIYRIATLDDATEGTRSHLWRLFRNRLKESGLIEGKNVVYEARFANGVPERLPGLAAELIAFRPDVIVAAGSPPTRAAMRATGVIPIVFAAAGDPAGAGLVASLARPGGNVTGTSTLTTDTTQKRLDLLRAIAPAVQRIGFLGDASNQASVLAYTRLEESARKLKISVQMLDAIGEAALERSFTTIRRDHVQGLLVGSSGNLLAHISQIVQFANKEKIPTVYGQPEFTDAGGLLAYSADREAAYAGGANFVQRILRGAKPADLPVEQIGQFRTIINLKTAQATGIKIPESVRLRADKVIE
jgi:putative ABC transport system substrate-binding protein